MIAGCLDWQAHGLIRSPLLKNATEEYFSDQDIFAQWLGDCCDQDRRFTGINGELYESYRAYVGARGERVQSQTWFGLKLKKRGFEKGKDNKDNRIFKGLRLRPTGWESEL